MRIKRLRIENFRKFRKPVELVGFGSGLNLICEPNEVGKSTVLEAMRAVLFERYSAKGEKVKSFRPQGDEVAPQLELEFEVGGAAWTVHKKFWEKPSVTLTDGAQRFQSDEAEERLQSLLGFARAGNRGADDESRGALGLLWVEQGQSFALDAPNQLARRTFESLLEGEVGAVTGGKRTVAVTKAVETSFAEYFTPTGRPARRLSLAEVAMDEANQRLASAQTQFAEFDQLLSSLDGKRSELRRVTREQNDEERIQANARIKSDIEKAKLATQELAKAEAAHKLMRGELKRAEEAVEQRRIDRQSLAKAIDEVSHKQTSVGENGLILNQLREVAQEASDKLKEQRTEFAQAELLVARSREALRSAREATVLIAGFGRLDRAMQLSADLHTIEEAIKVERMDPSKLAKLDGLDREIVQARAVVAAGSTTLTINLHSDARPVSLDGKVVNEDYKAIVETPQTISVADLVSITITPPASGLTAASKLRAAEQDLTAFLNTVGHASIETAREAAKLRLENVQHSKTLTARLNAECHADPELKIEAGLPALRAVLADVDRHSLAPASISELDAAEVAADRRFQDARQHETKAGELRASALANMQLAELEDIKLQSALQQAKSDADRIGSQLSQSEGRQSDNDLLAQLDSAKIEEARAVVAMDEARKANAGLDLSQLTRRLEAAERRSHQLNEDRVELSTSIARLEEQAKNLGGAGPAAVLEEAKGEVEACREALERVRHEASVIDLLRRVLSETRSEASKRFLAPVAKRVEPYLQRVLPNAALTFADDFKPTELTRMGRQESADHLSKGTQEQVAILTRLAFAELLLAKGKPASLVLDDALVFSDDDRFETMTEILSEAATRMQVIILSCRASAYRHVQATRIKIDR